MLYFRLAHSISLTTASARQLLRHDRHCHSSGNANNARKSGRRRYQLVFHNTSAHPASMVAG